MTFKELLGFIDKDINRNDNKYNGGLFRIENKALITVNAMIPLRNISKVWVGDIASRTHLTKWFWICSVFGILSLFSSMSSCASGLSDSENPMSAVATDLGGSLFVIALVLIIAACAMFAYVYWRNTRHEYALCIESNSGSVEMYRNDNLQILYSAQQCIEEGIKALNQGTVFYATYNTYNGSVSNDIILHGSNNNFGNVTTGYNNNVR